jgi:hypothetical protein
LGEKKKKKKEREKREMWEIFFPRAAARLSLLDVLHWIFGGVRCN